MGISVISSVSASSALPVLAGGLGLEALSTDFAALLGEQLSASLSSLVSQGDDSKTSSDEKLSLDPEQIAELAANNPLLAEQLLTMQQAQSNALALVAQAQQNSLSLSANKGQIPLISNVDRDKQNSTNNAESLDKLFSLPEESAATKDLLASIGIVSTGADGRSKSSATTPDFSETLSGAKAQTTLASNIASSTSAAIRSNTETTSLAEPAKITAEFSSNAPSSPSFTAALSTANTQAQPQVHSQNAQPVSSNIPTPIQDTRWAQDFGEKIVWLAKSDHQVAQININPPQLGPMQITLNLNGDQATAVFASPHAEVRQAIEDAMPRLREMLSSAGISLGDANVGTQLPQQNRDNASQFTNSSPNGARLSDENAILGGEKLLNSNTGSLPIQRGRGLVDLFA